MSLDLGNITPNTTFVNPGCERVDNAEICNAPGNERLVGSTLTMTQVLQYSLNMGVMWQLEQIGGGEINLVARETLYDYFKNHYGFGKKTGVEQPLEAVGTIFAPDREEGGRVRYANMTFGQGISVSMLQMAAAFSAVINGGTYYQPTLINGTLNEDGSEATQEARIIAKDIVSAKTGDDLRNMMKNARSASFPGTDKGYFVGSKTGTAQTYDPETGKYATDMTTGTMIGFGADADSTPRYVIMVRVEASASAGLAGTTAANPIFTAMSNWLNEYEGISK
jgi:cell division protein FtsI/penicillin-binding protein 2